MTYCERLLLIGLLTSCVSTVAHADSPKYPEVIDPVYIVGTTPLASPPQSLNTMTSMAQNASGQAFSDSQALNLADFLNSNFSGVHVNDNAGNPFEMDVNYRGYTASPLLGTPQGLSVFLDGVRMNQPFGDIVLWDLIPNGAISNITLMAGSTPVFGLNTLGGALVLQTKDGLSYTGSELELGLGSHARRTAEFETGGHNEAGWHWYALAHQFDEQGWRIDSPSEVQQLFGKLGWKRDSDEVKLTAAYFRSYLTGNGLQQQELLQSAFNSVYTIPDTTTSYANFLNLEFTHSWREGLQVSGNTYYRTTTTGTLNSDLNTNALGHALYGYDGQEQYWLVTHGLLSPLAGAAPASTAGAGFPYLRCLAQAGLSLEPNAYCDALLTVTSTDQTNRGFNLQVSHQAQGSLASNRLVLGAGYDRSDTRYVQQSQYGYLNPDRSMTLVNAWADGTQDSASVLDQRVDLLGRSATWSLFGSDTLGVNDVVNLSLFARYNATSIQNSDLLYPYNNAAIVSACSASGACAVSGTAADGSPIYAGMRGSLSGTHHYARLNPGAGLALTLQPGFNPYLGYSESSRTPTSIELGCADPNFGCRLPTGMSGDPHLNQVVTRTWELGARGKVSGPGQRWSAQWSASLFNALNMQDIIFVSTSTAGTGYFQNYGQTRRRGLELGLSGEANTLKYSINYSYIQATFQSAGTLGSQFNVAADALGNIQVAPGSQMPLNPHQVLNARLNIQLTPQWNAGLALNALGASFPVGNENNADASRIPGYAVWGLNGRFELGKAWEFAGQVANLFDTRYYTSGQLGPKAFTAMGGFTNDGSTGTPFYTPGGPRSLWLSARYSF